MGFKLLDKLFNKLFRSDIILSNRRLRVVLDGKSPQEYSVNAELIQLMLSQLHLEWPNGVDGIVDGECSRMG